VGSATAAAKQLLRYRDAGATDLVLSPLMGTDDDPRLLWEVAAALTDGG
jgi:hypothetical protein